MSIIEDPAEREKIAQLERKRRAAGPSDLQDCGWLQTLFPESFGSGGSVGPEIGIDGHLWIMIPISEAAAATVAKGAGTHKPIQEIIPGADNWKLHAMFYKFSRGFFKKPVWVCAIYVMANRQQIFLGFIAATSLRQFAADLRQMMEDGYPTFSTIREAYEAVP